MYRAMAFGDLHFTLNPPSGRTEAYPNRILAKLDEIVTIGNKMNVVFFLGDLFHRKERVSMREARMMIESFRKFEVPVYAICGSHDVSGHQIDSVKSRAIGVLEASGVVNLVGREPVEVADGLFVAGESCHIEYEHGASYSVGAEPVTGVLVWLSHGVLSDKKLPYETTDPKHLLKNMEADILLNGHYHSVPKMWESKDKLIVNCGSVARTARDDEHNPSVVVLAVNPEKHTWVHKTIELKRVDPHGEVFGDVEESTKMNDEDIKLFVETLAKESGDVQDEDLKAVVGEVCKERSKEVKTAVLSRLDLV